MDGYFKVMNVHFPLLHQPTFEKQLEDRLYERDIWFGCLCMSVFGVGARWSKNPGVLWDDDKGLSEIPEPSSPLWGSAGWKYIQVALGEFVRLSRANGGNLNDTILQTSIALTLMSFFPRVCMRFSRIMSVVPMHTCDGYLI